MPLVAFVGLAQTCTITISGFYATGAQVASESFEFGNTAGLSNSLVFVRPQGVWKELRNVTFAVTSALLVTSTVQMVVDNVQHCNYLDRQGVEESASELAEATVATSLVGLSASTAMASSLS